MSEGQSALSTEEIDALLGGVDLPLGAKKEYKYFTPTGDAVDRWVQYAKGSEDCFYLGLTEIDQRMRGVWPSDVLVVTGRAHSGKSAVLLSSLAWNLKEDEEFHGVIFTPDEPEVLVVAKLYALLYQRNLAEVEQALAAEDPLYMAEIMEAKERYLDRLKIFPSALKFPQMSEAMRECEDYWQYKPKFVWVDFLEQLPMASGYEGVSKVL